MNWQIAVLSTVSSDTEPTIVITFDHAKYVFNAGENTNRAFTQSKRSWSKTKAVFLTQTGTQRTAGLPSLLMAFADAAIPRLEILGPPGIKHLVASMRSYMYRDKLPIIPVETSFDLAIPSNPEPVFKDEYVTVYSIPIYESTDGSLKRKRETSPEIDAPSKRQQIESATGDAGDATMTTAHDSKDIALEGTELSLEEMFKEPSFSSASLTGEKAQEWRDLLIDIMFPASKSEKARMAAAAASKGKGKETQDRGDRKKKKGKQTEKKQSDTGRKWSKFEGLEGEGGNIDDYRRPLLVKGFHEQLPRYTVPEGVPTSKRALAYVVLGPRARGKFNAEKAAELKVPGRLRSKLTDGKEISYKVKENGVEIERTVKPEEIIGPSQSPSVAIILDIPTVNHIPSLVSAFSDDTFYSKFRSPKPEHDEEFVVRSVFHTCGDGVLEDERYLEFIRGFPSDIHHIVASKEHLPDPLTFTSSGYQQLKLNQLDPEIFSIPKYNLEPKKDAAAIPNLPKSFTLMQANMLVSLRPPGRPHQEQTAIDSDRFHPVVKEGIVLKEHTAEYFAAGKKSVVEFETSGKRKTLKGEDVGVITLGTASAVPGKYRNVSATAIQIPGHGNILLDCGEGTWGQLARQFGTDKSSPTNVYQFLRDLKCLYVSHVHADHHMGVAKLLAQRKLLDPPPEQPLYLVTIRPVHVYLREYCDLEDLGLFDSHNGVITVLSPALHWRQGDSYPSQGLWSIGGVEPWLDIKESKAKAEEMCRSLGLATFRTVDVRHRTRCYGAVLRHQDGWSVVFSADTMPSDNLVYAGQRATVLIHEATMSDDQADMAAQKAHSTVGQALAIGKRMNADNILLTHFSARRPKIPHQVTKPEDDEPFVVTAFDYANLKIGNMWKMQFYMAAVEQSYQEMIAEVGEEDEEAEEAAHAMTQDYGS